MTWRGNKPNTEAFNVVVGVVQRVDFKFASITRSGIDLAYRETAAKTPPRRTTNRCREFGHCGVIWRGGLLGEWLAKQTLKKQLAHIDLPSKIVARIRTVERLVAERKVRDDIVFNRGLQEWPLKP